MTRRLALECELGTLRLEANHDGLSGIYWPNQSPRTERDSSSLESVTKGCDPLLDNACEQLYAYLYGRLTQFDLPLSPAGTAFQKQVWQALTGITYGTTISYGELAQRLGRPSSARAVASAVGKNPLAMVIPCHRVIGANGSLTGFAGGLSRKRWLLCLETETRR